MEKKLLYIGKVYGNKAFCYVEIKNGVLYISGVIGPLDSGSCKSSCGQINSSFKEVEEGYIEYADGWSEEKLMVFLLVWDKWHLNDMNAACFHQRMLGWKYDDHRDEKSFTGDACPICGYHIGSRWIKEELPVEVVEYIEGLPYVDWSMIPAAWRR